MKIKVNSFVFTEVRVSLKVVLLDQVLEVSDDDNTRLLFKLKGCSFLPIMKHIKPESGEK